MKSFLLFPFVLIAMIGLMLYAWWPENRQAN
jgi:hypothetical protein